MLTLWLVKVNLTDGNLGYKVPVSPGFIHHPDPKIYPTSLLQLFPLTDTAGMMKLAREGVKNATRVLF